jgi:hypothetical protein
VRQDVFQSICKHLNSRKSLNQLFESLPYHAKLFAHEISRRHVSSDLEKFIPTLMGARVDLNPHQIDAALFVFHSPLTDGKKGIVI